MLRSGLRPGFSRWARLFKLVLCWRLLIFVPLVCARKIVKIYILKIFLYKTGKKFWPRTIFGPIGLRIEAFSY
jgi:hypothetical protein